MVLFQLEVGLATIAYGFIQDVWVAVYAEIVLSHLLV